MTVWSLRFNPANVRYLGLCLFLLSIRSKGRSAQVLGRRFVEILVSDKMPFGGHEMHSGLKPPEYWTLSNRCGNPKECFLFMADFVFLLLFSMFVS